ncbi:MAG: sigma 54-interacting transcriptional regulator [Candidatus Sumerlaeia bacterium]|nr:sigma 54-interacting transcriptional regulator [Candidatus Sumerlaeia bacterium]
MKVSSQKALPGISSLISAANELVRAASLNDNPILITGEVGTEKSFAAKLIHQLGKRGNRPLVKLNVSWKLPPNLSQYFHQCDGGTLIIQLQKDFPIDMQYTLVEMVSHGCFADPMSGDLIESDVRMVLTSTLELDEFDARSPLLPDLREILGAQHISIPPLRSRTEDIPALVRYAMNRALETGKSKAKKADPAVLSLFRQWKWPGNTEDLLLVTAQAAITCKGEVLELSDLPESFLKQLPSELIESARIEIPEEDPDTGRHETIDPDTSEPEPITGASDIHDALDPPTTGQNIAGAGHPYARRTPLPTNPADDTAKSDPETTSMHGLRHDTRATRVLQLARRLNAQSQVLSRQMSGPLPTRSTEEIMEHLMKEATDDEALESLESELDRGLELVMAMRRQLAMLNVRQQQTQETIRDLVQRINLTGGVDEASNAEIAREAQELSETLKAIDTIVEKVTNQLPRTSEHFEAVAQGKLPERDSMTSGIFRKPINLEEEKEPEGN